MCPQGNEHCSNPDCTCDPCWCKPEACCSDPDTECYENN